MLIYISFLGATASPLPDLPEDLRQVQEAMSPRVPSPPKQTKSITPRGRNHAAGPIVPPSTKPKGEHGLKPGSEG